MSKLGFASVVEAYSIGSQQIKTERDEITRLKNIITEASKTKNGLYADQDYKRIGSPDRVNATFCNKKDSIEEMDVDHLEYTFLKLMRSHISILQVKLRKSILTSQFSKLRMKLKILNYLKSNY